MYQYKYIVDGEWQVDPQQPTMKEHGVENNIIEVHPQRKEDKLANQKGTILFGDDDDFETH